jgi:glycosyltransferase involved in cell wall biosynthesis
MKICLVGPGIMTIPPIGWGAVEILIWDYYCELKKNEIDVTIVNKFRNSSREQMISNSDYCQELINEINIGNYDFVHIHYDCLFHIVPFLKCKKIGLTSHYPYINNKDKHIVDGFERTFNYMISNPERCLNLVLAEDDMKFMINNGINRETIYKLENGIDKEKFKFSENPNKKDKTIYLGKITDRKGQRKYQELENIEFIGPNGNGLKNWKGEWTREEVFNNLTNYGNMLLLSDGEADPLVIKEALISGLGVIINETSGKNLEANDFITIIPENKMSDLSYIEKKMEENRNNSLRNRDKIRKYGEDKFGWNNLIKNYLNIITNNI